MSTEIPKNKLFLKIKKFWLKYELKTILILGFILVAIISFQLGFIQGKKGPNKPLIIEKTVESTATEANLSSTPVSGGQNLTQESQKSAASIQTPKADCPFVGSKNSNKYHVPTCQWAKRIKPENIVCFKDETDAKNRGYLPDSCVGKQP